jgi:hypothetical protein
VLVKNIEDIETKRVYAYYCKQISKWHSSDNKWKENFELPQKDGAIIYTSAFKQTRDTKLQTLQFKISQKNIGLWNSTLYMKN